MRDGGPLPIGRSHSEYPWLLGFQSMTDPVILPAMSPAPYPSPPSELLKYLLCQCRDEIQKPPTAKCGNRCAIHLVSPGHLKSWLS